MKRGAVNTLAVIGGITLLILLLGGAGFAAYSAISYEFTRISYSFRFPSFLMTIRYKVNNNNPFGVKIEGFDGKLFYKGQFLGTIRLEQPFVISANGSADLALLVNVNLADSTESIINIFTTPGVLTYVDVKGTLITDVARIPVNSSVPLL